MISLISVTLLLVGIFIVNFIDDEWEDVGIVLIWLGLVGIYCAFVIFSIKYLP